MSTLSQIHTFLKAYFGDALSRVLALFSRRSAVVKPTVEALSDVGVLTADGESKHEDADLDESKNEDSALHTTQCTEASDSTASEVESAVHNPDGTELLTEAVAEVLPSLPSIFKFPADFGPPSGLYYDRRFPLGNVTNVLRNNDNVPPMKLQTQVQSLPRKPKAKSKHTRTRKEVNWSLPTGVPNGRRERSKNARPLYVPEIPMDQIVDCAYVPPEVSTVAQDTLPVDDGDATPAPGSEEWNTNKAALLDQVRSWSDQVKASRRNSLSPIPRHSAPAVLVASTKAPRLDLQDLLSALIQDATDTIAALDAKEDSVVNPLRTRSRTLAQLPAPTLISSISASHSMAAPANASTRSLSDLLDGFDDAMASPRWRRLLLRSDDIKRRNDSIV
ncbi:hypothetical protein B0H16DRAFT_1738652 [Mycena metata]|uniref:Uncharacterized protein n=1 Tax=Mycena metata TaxID=1033252 RepID=A0AAD7HIU5_9AGAR|nr:hypothetical protein B0H16DRAFT_1738652 [Mycena metata]